MFKNKKKEQLKNIHEECWNIDYELIKWLNEHLKVYIQDCNVDLDCEKFTYKGKEKTFREVLNRLIEITDILYNNGEYIFDNIGNLTIKQTNNLKNEMYDLLKLVHWQLWW